MVYNNRLVQGLHDRGRRLNAVSWVTTQKNTKSWTNVDLRLGQRRRRWPYIKPALDQSIMQNGKITQQTRDIEPMFG